MSKAEQAKSPNKDHYYVYFLESHISTASPKITLAGSNLDLVGKLENKKEVDYNEEKTKQSYKYTLYRIEIYPEKIKDKDKDKLELKIELEDENKMVFNSYITITEFDRDNYIYDFEFKARGFIKKGFPPESIKFTQAQQLEIFENYLQKDLQKKRNECKERQDLVICTQKLLDQKFSFYLYLLLFLECFNTPLFTALFNLFEPNKIDKKEKAGDITKYSRRVINYIDMCIKRQDKIFNDIKDEKQKENIWIKFFFLALYFYQEYLPDKFQEILKKDIGKSLTVLMNYNYMFSDLKLQKETVQKLIDKSTNYSQFVNSLQYINNLSELLDIIISSFDKFKEFYKDNNKEKINIEQLIEPKKEDNIEEICNKYKTLVNMQMKDINCDMQKIPINISGSLFDKYISLFEGVNLKNIFHIKEIVKSLGIDIQKNIYKSYFDTGLYFCKNGKMTNLEILAFIDNLIKEERKKESLDILSWIKIEEINEQFYEEWKKINWFKIYEKYIKSFTENIIELIKNIKDFDILFKLFNISDEPNIIKIYSSTLEILQTKFIELLKNYDFKSDIDINKNIVSLVVNSDNKDKGTKSDLEFLKQIQYSLNAKMIKEIYKTFLSKYGELLKFDLKKFLIDYFTKEIDARAEIFLEVIKDCPKKIIENILENLNRYIPNEQDFLDIEKNEKYELFKGLLDQKIISDEEFKYTFYIKQAEEKITKLQKDFISGEIKYSDIFIFYGEQKEKEDLLLLKIETIFLNDKEKANSVKLNLDELNKKIKNALDDLNLILEDFLEFLSETKNDNIVIIRNFISEMNTGSFNYYEKNKEKIDNLIKDNKKNALKRNSYKNSAFFQSIYKQNKKYYKQNNENYWLESSERDFENLKNIFNNQGLQTLDENLLKISIETIKGKNEEDIKNELEYLLELYKINIPNVRKSEIIKELMLLSKKDDLDKISLAISIFFKRTNIKPGSLSNLLKQIIDDSKALVDPKKIEEYINDLNTYKIDINILNDPNYKGDNYLKIFLELSRQPDAIDFLIKDNDIEKLRETAGNNDIGFLSVNDIDDFEKCVKFIKKLDIKNKTDEQFIIKFQEGVKNEEKIELFFCKYLNNYTEIKNQYDVSFDKSRTAKEQIKAICKESKFIFKNIKGEFYKGDYSKEFGKFNQKIKISSLKELRERAHVTKKTNNDNEKEIRKFFDAFVDKATIILKIYELIKELYDSGYFNIIEIIVTINNKKANYEGFGLKTDNSEDMLKKIKDELNTFKTKQKSAYRDRPLLRYIYGRQFNLIYDKIVKKMAGIDISPILMLISNNTDINNIKTDFNFDITKYKDVYEMIDEYLKTLLEQNKINKNIIDESHKISRLDGDEDYKGIYSFKGDNIQKDVIQIYKYLTKKNPQAQYNLICSKETTSEELTAFLYRAIYCDLPSCFIIAGIELLSFNQKIVFQSLLRELYTENENKMKSSLIMVYTDVESDIVKYIMNLKNRKFLKNEKLIREEEIGKSESVLIISSDQAGVGKSTYIKKIIEESKRKYIYFPFGGVFTRKDILKRLKELPITNNATIHLDLYDTEQIDLTMEFLFSILITKIYGQNEDIFYLSKNVYIYIEIPNGFVDFMKKFPILDIFPNESLKIDELKPLIVEKDIKTNVQIVSNYLKVLYNNINELDKKDLYFEGVTPKDFINNKSEKEIIRAELLEQKTCQDLILRKIKERINQPNYYQITSFIEVLGSQLRKFSQSTLLSANYFNDSDERFKPFFRDMRSYVLIKIIEFTKYFTEGTFSDFIKTFKKSYSQIIRKFDEDKDNEEAIERLSKEIDCNDVVSFDKVYPSLFIFDEGNGEGFRVISNQKPENQRDVKKYSVIYQTQYLNKDSYMIPIFEEKNFDNEDKEKEYLDELKNIILNEMKSLLSIKNEVGKQLTEEEIKEIIKKEKKKKEEKEKEKKEKEEMVKQKKKENEKYYDDDDEDDENSDDEENVECETETELKTLNEITENYVFTTDNYFKMALILLKIRANIPVIMMGETGCGKTSLIRKLSELLNNGSKDSMKILNIHAGTSDKDIIKFLEKKVIPHAKVLEEKDNKKKEEMKKKLIEKKLDSNFVYYEQKLWVFLDEINTCKSMGLISEIMCKNSYQGKPLPKNITFIAACNPYRYDTKKLKQKAGLNIKNAKKQINENIKDIKEKNHIEKSSTSKALVYTVNPLPHSLLNYVFNFGNLKDDDEKKYIKSMTKEVIDSNKLHKLAVDLIVISQKFIRKKNDKSSVSLREISRFKIFYKFFFNYLKDKKKINFNKLENKKIEQEEIDFIKDLSNEKMQMYSIFLSVFACYYLRITDNQTRKELENELDRVLYENNIKEKFLKIPLREEIYIANNIEVEKGIAKNKALLDNLFALFITINTKVPIFIVGKPGCSKSLSVQLISKAMKGKSDNGNLLFNNLPRVIMSSFQGSMGSTSKGVKSVFKKARDILKNSRNREEGNREYNEIISMIFFDEMGLAEHSPNNPLKVIHSELEYDYNEGDKKVAFVGISNWALDASKMNRGLFLSIPDPDIEDAKKTSLTIGESYNPDIAKHFKSLYENIGETYLKYKKFLYDKFNNGLEEFHGNRDFYHLVKNIARSIVNNGKNSLDNNTKNNFIIQGIERNFAGLLSENPRETSLKIFKRFYRDKDNSVQTEDKYFVLKRIEENIKDSKSRYLLVISKPSISEFLLSSILTSQNKEYNYYKGSPFKEDQKSEGYILKLLNKIQLNMEQNKVLILNNLGTVYPGLYDLFNQNFTVISKKNYARIALGYTTNAYSIVNDNFRCIVNVDEDKILNEEPPFLNRFEKHIISFENLLDKVYIEKADEIYKNLMKLTENEGPNKIFEGINYSLKDIFINLDKEEIRGYIYKITNNNKDYDMNDLVEKVIDKISLLLPQDIIIFQKYSGKCGEYAEKILAGYKKGEHTKLSSFLQTMKNLQNVVYTFSDILSDIDDFKNLNINNELIGNIKKKNIFSIQISSFDSENRFEDKINEYFNDKNKKVCLIKFKSNERHFLNYVKFFIENISKENKITDKKAFIFIVYLERNFEDNNNNNLIIRRYSTRKIRFIDENNDIEQNETISLTSDFYQIFIDDLNGNSKFTLEVLLNLKGKELFEKCIDFEQRLKENIYRAVSYMKYDIPYSFFDLNNKKYPAKLIDFILKDESKYLKGKINQIITKQMEKEEKMIENALKTKNIITKYDIDLINVIQRYINEQYSYYLIKLYYKAENDQFFSTLLYSQILMENKQKENDNIIIDEENENIVKEKEKENKHRSNVIKKVIDSYLNNYILENEKDNYIDKDNEKNNNNNVVNENIEANEIKVFFGLQLAGMFPIISSLMKKSKNEIIKKYQINEKILRNDMEDNEIIMNSKLIYEQKLRALNNTIFIELDKNNEIKNIISENNYEKDEFIDLFLEDYYVIFIYNNLNNFIMNLKQNNKDFLLDLSKLVKILKLIVSQKKDKDKENVEIEEIASIINWLECYSTQISYMLKIFLVLNKYIPDFDTLIENIIIKSEITYENYEQNKEYKSAVNKALFLLLESILKIITSNTEIYLTLKKDDFLKLININKEIKNQMKKFIINLQIYSKEIFSLEEILLLIDYLNEKNICTTNNLKTLLAYFTKKADNNEQSLELFQEYYKNLEDILGKDNEKEYYKLTSVIFKNEFNKFNENIDIKKKIIEIITSNDRYILNNIQIFKLIIKIDISPTKIRDNLNQIKEDDKLLKVINDKCNKEVSESLIFNIFDYEFEKYFSRTRAKIKNLSIKEEEKELKELKELFPRLNQTYKDTNIVFDLSFNILKDCIQFLDDIDKNKNYNLAKLYAISYIKIYFRILVDLSLNQNQNLGSTKEIMDFINNKNNKFRDVIKIYIIKLLFYSSKSFDDFKRINLDSIDLGFLKSLLDEEKPENEFMKDIKGKKNIAENIKYKDYPYIKYFTYTMNSKKAFDIFKSKINEANMDKYPILYKYLKLNDKKEEIEKAKYISLKHLEKYNDFCNFMIDNYSFKITREDAKKKIFKEEPIFKAIKENKFKEFKTCWKDMYKFAINYKNEKIPIREPKDLENDCLAYFLNDVNEKGFGMYIAAGYEFFIKKQNEFLKYILEKGKDKPYLKFYFETIENKIPIYEANNNQILLLFDLYSISEFDNFRDLVNTFTKINIFKEDGKVDYDIESVEEELSKLILTGKCMFEDENNLNFINYWGESFGTGKSDFLERFEKKYETMELTMDEKININNYLKDKYEPNDYKDIYGNIQILMFYLINNNCDENKYISDLFNDLPDYINKKFDETFRGIFSANGKELVTKKLISIFLFFEHLCFEIFSSNLILEYQAKILEEDKNNITDNYMNNDKENYKALSAAVRRFISRILFRIKNKDNFSPNIDLIKELSSINLWDKKYRNPETIEKILEQIKKFNLTIGQSYEFYQLIKSEDEKEIIAFAEKEQPERGALINPQKRKRKFQN